MKIALALSGGGHRAAAFHLGVLKYLAQRKLLENVSDISSASGGSIVIAQIFHNSKSNEDMLASKEALKWPESDDFIRTTLPLCKTQLIQQSLENHFIKRMLWPRNWLKFGHRANLMASVLKNLWSMEGLVEDLPDRPNWVINGTTNLSGCRWRVEHRAEGNYMGSNDLGFSDSNKFPIADAIAISAAYPGIIGPYRMEMGNEYVYLSDGGLYDNLGLDAVFDLESQTMRKDIDADFLLVSDASKGINHKKLAPVWRPLLRTIRLIDVINQQVRSLRLRTLLPFFKKKSQQGVYIAIGQSYTNSRELPRELVDYSFLSAAKVEQAKNMKTSLASLTEDEFELLVRHGYESALVQFRVLTSQQVVMS